MPRWSLGLVVAAALVVHGPRLGALILVTAAWWRSSGSWPFVVVVMGVPVVVGYLMPWIATSVVKRWRFTGGPRVSSHCVHHGFIYGAKLAFALLLVIRSLEAIVSR